MHWNISNKNKVYIYREREGYDTLELEVNVSYAQKFSPYLTENTIRPHYKD
jgi:hypothetical protein